MGIPPPGVPLLYLTSMPNTYFLFPHNIQFPFPRGFPAFGNFGERGHTHLCLTLLAVYVLTLEMET